MGALGWLHIEGIPGPSGLKEHVSDPFFPYFPQASQRRQRQGKWVYFSVRKPLGRRFEGDSCQRVNTQLPPCLHPGRSEEDRVRNEYEESQWTGDRDTRSSMVSGGGPDTPLTGN